MSVWWILLLAVGAFPAFLLCCFVVGFVSALLGEIGIRRKPKFRVIRYEETE